MVDRRTFHRCIVVIIIIIVIIFILAGLTLSWWDTSGLTPSPPAPSPPSPPTTTDTFTFSQYVSAKVGQSAQQEIKATDGSILGEARQVFLPPPVGEPSVIRIDDGAIKYTYRGDGANGFEVRWLGFTNESTLSVVDLSDLEKFTVDVTELDFANEGTTFTLQMNVLDKEGLESSVIDIVREPKTVSFDKNSFIGTGRNSSDGQRIDFSNVTGIWMGGDFRMALSTDSASSASGTNGSTVTLKPLTFVRS